jgi:hypothetical protein
MVALTLHASQPPVDLGRTAAANIPSIFTTEEDRREHLRQAMRFDSAGQAAQEYWRAIERAQAVRPDLMERLVQVCVQDNIPLRELYQRAAEPKALTMYMVVARAAAI